MRYVPIAEFKDRMAEVMTAAVNGEDVIITRHGRDYVRLVPMQNDDVEAKRRALADLAAFRAAQRDRGVPPTTRDDIRAWIDEGRS